MPDSWSALRKRLEQDFLCPALRGRVQYFLTHYHGAPDNYGRFCIRVDGEEHVMANPYDYYVKGYDCEEYRLKEERGIPEREWTGKGTLHEAENQAVEDEVERQAISDGVFEIWFVTRALRQYTQSPKTRWCGCLPCWIGGWESARSCVWRRRRRFSRNGCAFSTYCGWRRRGWLRRDYHPSHGLGRHHSGLPPL